MSAHREASDPRRSAWVSANAGTGKTYTLANRVTRLLLEGARPERILCLTYTKAAAAEMSARLFAQLGSWAMAPDSDLSSRIAEIGGEVRDPDGLRAARRLFALALETPGGLKIQTIHSFCQQILARFPMEAGVAPGFRVLDDATGRALRNAATAKVLERAGQGEQALADAVALLATETSEFRIRTILGDGLGGDRRKLERFLGGLSPDQGDLTARLADSHGRALSDTAESVVAEFLRAMKREEPSLQNIAAWLGGGSKQDIEHGARLRQALADGRYESFAAVFHTSTGTLRAKWATNGRKKAAPELSARFEAMAAEFDAVEERRRAARAAHLAEAALSLLLAARTEYDSAKLARNALDYDDLVADTARLLDSAAAAQWVLYKLDGGLDHVLIDEAQDTSPEQWSIVTRLTEEFFAGNGVERGAPRTIFAVGDEKQSIFSFQGAEPTEFDRHRRHFAQTIPPHLFADVRLEESRRSVPQVLRFVDETFAAREVREGVVSGPDPITHSAWRAGDSGLVEIWPLVLPEDASEPDYWRPVDKPSIVSPVVRLAEEIANRVRQMTDGTHYLPGKDRAIRPGDIMVLTPRREPFASAFIRALKARDVPVAGADRLRLNEQMAVLDLIALGRLALLREDDLNLASLLRSPLVNLSEDQLYTLCRNRTGTLFDAIATAGPAEELAPIAEFLAHTLRRADQTPPYEFYATLLATAGMRRGLLARLGHESADAMDEFLSLAIAYESFNTPSLEGFLHWVESGDAETRRDMERERDEVRVMTVHGAKGLEADIVILPDTTARPDGARKRGDILYSERGPVIALGDPEAPRAVMQAKADADRKLREEHRRLLYVALTRARDRLYVCGFRGKNALSPDSWYAHAERAADALATKDTDGLYTIGEAAFLSGARAQGAAIEEPARPAWVNVVAPQEITARRMVRPSLDFEEGEAVSFSPAGGAMPLRRGTLIHALLAHLPAFPDAERRSRAERYLAGSGLSPSDMEDIVSETMKVLADERFADAFGPNARAEVPLIADLPELGAGVRVRGRIDRLAISDTHVLILDFKTNRAPPVTADDIPSAYLMQMALYRAATARLFPGRVIRCGFLWTAAPMFSSLNDAALDEALRRAGGRLDPHPVAS